MVLCDERLEWIVCSMATIEKCTTVVNHFCDCLLKQFHTIHLDHNCCSTFGLQLNTKGLVLSMESASWDCIGFRVTECFIQFDRGFLLAFGSYTSPYACSVTGFECISFISSHILVRINWHTEHRSVCIHSVRILASYLLKNDSPFIRIIICAIHLMDCSV